MRQRAPSAKNEFAPASLSISSGSSGGALAGSPSGRPDSRQPIEDPPASVARRQSKTPRRSWVAPAPPAFPHPRANSPAPIGVSVHHQHPQPPTMQSLAVGGARAALPRPLRPQAAAAPLLARPQCCLQPPRQPLGLGAAAPQQVRAAAGRTRGAGVVRSPPCLLTLSGLTLCCHAAGAPAAAAVAAAAAAAAAAVRSAAARGCGGGQRRGGGGGGRAAQERRCREDRLLRLPLVRSHTSQEADGPAKPYACMAEVQRRGGRHAHPTPRLRAAEHATTLLLHSPPAPLRTRPPARPGTPSTSCSTSSTSPRSTSSPRPGSWPPSSSVRRPDRPVCQPHELCSLPSLEPDRGVCRRSRCWRRCGAGMRAANPAAVGTRVHAAPCGQASMLVAPRSRPAVASGTFMCVLWALRLQPLPRVSWADIRALAPVRLSAVASTAAGSRSCRLAGWLSGAGALRCWLGGGLGSAQRPRPPPPRQPASPTACCSPRCSPAPLRRQVALFHTIGHVSACVSFSQMAVSFAHVVRWVVGCAARTQGL